MDWMQMISTFGFPIVACAAMGMYVKYITDRHDNQIAELNKRHAEEMKEVTTAINNNTIALTKLAERLGGDL